MESGDIFRSELHCNFLALTVLATKKNILSKVIFGCSMTKDEFDKKPHQQVMCDNASLCGEAGKLTREADKGSKESY
jgi:hypothetical protein